MKKKFTIEFKLILLATVVLLAIATASVLSRVFPRPRENVTFVYNSVTEAFVPQVNISDILLFGEV